MSGWGAPSRERDAAAAPEAPAGHEATESTREPEAPGPVVAEPEAEAVEPVAAEHEATGGTAGGDGGQGAALLPDVVALTAERDEYLSALQRLQADFENYRKRVLRQLEEQSARGAAALVSKLLPILDVLDLAESHLGAGADAESEAQALVQARSLMVDVLSKEGLERVDEADVPFDPVVHDAVAHSPAGEEQRGEERPGEGEPGEERRGEGEPGEGEATAVPDAAGPVVAEVMRAGYRWHGQVLRPAMVRVRG